jgi:hypothetical protein
MSQRYFEWELVDMVLETTSSAGPTTVTATNTNTVTQETTKTEESPINVLPVFFAITFTAFIAVYRRRNDE